MTAPVKRQGAADEAGMAGVRRGYAIVMGENTDKLKGHAKEAAGDITDDKDLEREGKIDRASGTVKGKIDDLTDKLKR